MKGNFVSGKTIENYLRNLLYEGILLGCEERRQRLFVLYQLHLINFDTFSHYYNSIGVKFGPPEPSGELSFSEMLKEV